MIVSSTAVSVGMDVGSHEERSLDSSSSSSGCSQITMTDEPSLSEDGDSDSSDDDSEEQSHDNNKANRRTCAAPRNSPCQVVSGGQDAEAAGHSPSSLQALTQVGISARKSSAFVYDVPCTTSPIQPGLKLKR